MNWRAFINNMLSNLVWWLLLLVGGTTLTVVKLYWPRIADPALEGLAGLACIAVIAFSVKGKGLLEPNPKKITPENVEDVLRQWLDTFRISCRKEVASPGMHFMLVVTLRSGNLIGISRTADAGDYLTFQTRIALSAEHQAAMGAMTNVKSEETIREIVLEFLRARINFALEGPPFRAMILTKVLRISGSLAEDKFISALDEIDHAANMAKVATSTAIDRNSVSSITPKSPKPPERGRSR